MDLKCQGLVLVVGLVLGLVATEGSMESSRLSARSYDYGNALKKAILFFEGQRSGKLPSKQRVEWRGDSALTDGQQDKVKLVGGYYDAGDNVKFVWPMSFTITLLSWAGIEFREQVSYAGQLGHLRTAVRWGAKFLLRAHTSPTVLYTQVGDGSTDHQCWERPEDMDTPRTLYKITAGSPGTEAAADAAAALASASMVFRSDNSTYWSKLLNRSKLLFEFANDYRGSYQASCPFYCSFSGYQDELLWAAAWLFKATNDAKYQKFVLENIEWSRSVSEFSWDNKYIGAQVLLAKEHLAGNKNLRKYKTDADAFVCSLMPNSGSVQIQTTPGGLLFTRDTANLQYVTTAALVLFVYSKTLKSAGLDGVDYILGNNPLNFSYMVGYGNAYSKRIHHRGASIPSINVLPRKVSCKEGFSTWFPTNDPNPNTHVGAIVGGPDSNDRFNDVRSDSSHLEPTTYINAAFVGAAAALIEEQCFLQQPFSSSAVASE
uniref:Endoglucanase n=1 Tax=Ananas comosus var. bracteatus TaxID=296719 RepID=A0A6V7PT82_ANACO|nr:unnamed protein product [Ananas comosus var. bracteatus]